MEKVVWLLVLGILVVSLISVGVLADESVDGEIVVGFYENVTEEQVDSLIINSKNLTYRLPVGFSWENSSWGVVKTYVEVPIGEEQAWIDIFKEESIVRYAERNPIMQLAICDSDNLDLCTGNSECTNAGGFWYNGACNEEEQEEEDEDDNETGQGNQGLGQIIRGRVKAGVYTSPTGEQIRVRELAQNRFLLQVNNVSADCGLNLTQEQVQNKTKLKVKLSNGRNAEVKVMPDRASEKALERLRLKACSAENNCSIELKEVGKGEQAKLAYELQAERHAKLLGMFRAKMQVKAQVDAETGEIIRVKKPWWAFLATESEE